MSATHVTRFAPSPTGYLHLGNARTALYNALAARSSGGRFVLRIEDTDAGRSDETMLGQLLHDLAWLGLVWDEGPDIGGANGPYRQSERAASYAHAIGQLDRRQLTYPCFCTPDELAFERRAQLASGRPPRYSSRCASLTVDEVQRRLAAGARPATRFRVPPGLHVEFDDAIHGRQRFATDDIGDFVIRRADGSVAFFLGNAVDDAAMGVTLVLRGDDHLANTPRQILLLRALEMAIPEYGHLPLVLAPAGAPLSKREGAASLADLRTEGYLPLALCNYLVRLGHACDAAGWLDMTTMSQSFSLRRTSRSAPHFDPVQLRHWQREAIAHAATDELETWLGSRLDAVPDADRRTFVAAVRSNLMFPVDVEPLVAIVYGDRLTSSADAQASIASAGPQFFDIARRKWHENGPDFHNWTRAVATATQAKGASLYMPLRAALTGSTHGPELAPLVALMGHERVARRLAAAAAK